MIAAPALAAPLFTTLLGSPSVTADPSNLVVAALPVLFVLIAGSWVSTRRWSRLSVVEAIRAERRDRVAVAPSPVSPTRQPSLAVMLGLKDRSPGEAGRPARYRGRALDIRGRVRPVLQATLAARDSNEASDVPSELPALVYTLDAILISIVVTTLVAVALLAVRERVRDFGVLRTVGFTPHQVSSSLVGAHAVVAVLTSLVSIPLGVALYVGVYGPGGGDSNDLVIAPWWWLALVAVVAAAMVIVATGLPARISADADHRRAALRVTAGVITGRSETSPGWCPSNSGDR